MSDVSREALKARLYAALKHEKSCGCGECSGGLNAVDALLALVEQQEKALMLCCGELQDLHAGYLDSRSAEYEPPDDGDVRQLVERFLGFAALSGGSDE